MTLELKNLKTDLRIACVDDFYQSLIDLHSGLSDYESQKLNAKLVLLLCNHIGDEKVLHEALACAKPGTVPRETRQ